MKSLQAKNNRGRFSIGLFAWAVLVLMAPAPAGAVIERIQIVPPQPTPGDIITISASGYLSDGCWNADQAALTQDGHAFVIDVTAVDKATPQMACILIIIPYTPSFEIGPLEAGVYAVTVNENRQSLRDPGTDTKTVSFGVGCNALCADANCDGALNVGDVVYLTEHIFKSGPAPISAEMADANHDGSINVGDALVLINYIFTRGPAPACK